MSIYLFSDFLSTPWPKAIDEAVPPHWRDFVYGLLGVLPSSPEPLRMKARIDAKYDPAQITVRWMCKENVWSDCLLMPQDDDLLQSLVWVDVVTLRIDLLTFKIDFWAEGFRAPCEYRRQKPIQPGRTWPLSQYKP